MPKIHYPQIWRGIVLEVHNERFGHIYSCPFDQKKGTYLHLSLFLASQPKAPKFTNFSFSDVAFFFFFLRNLQWDTLVTNDPSPLVSPKESKSIMGIIIKKKYYWNKLFKCEMWL